uniref:Keratin n=1 Tax=Crocodylus porosus TaxID=8502 RepID=A0A7M4F744_CROPO
MSQSLSSRCLPPCSDICPRPCVDAWNWPCVTSCGDSRAVVHPPPVVVHFPGPILASCPQESITLVGSSALFDMERLLGSRRSFEFEGPLGLGGICGPGSLCNSEPFGDFPYGNCGPV